MSKTIFGFVINKMDFSWRGNKWELFVRYTDGTKDTFYFPTKKAAKAYYNQMSR